jgi:hypothetical protein
VCVRKMKALTMKMETMTLTGIGRLNLTFFVYYVYEIKSKIFLPEVLFLGVVTD